LEFILYGPPLRQNSQMSTSHSTDQQTVVMRAVESRHRKLDIQSLGRGYPDTLQVFQMPASKFWYVGMYVSARSRFVKKSTRCERLIDAKDFAKE
jgi:hypothetical protein